MVLQDMDIVNYCHPNCKPLQNIMRLQEEKAFALAARLAAENPDTTAFGRFADFQHYYPRRRETDAQLYAAFTALGGRPAEKHPLSFALQGSDYLDGWFDHGIVTRIPLRCVPPEHISFTLGDSMAMLAREGSFTMLTLDMLEKEMTAHAQGPAGYLKDVQERYRYMEVQLWDDAACFFVKLARRLSLGELTAPAVRLSGGFTHRMFRLDTTTGRYAVKLLNPEIMKRPDALDNYLAAEKFEALLEAAELPILPAKTINGRKMHCVDGQYLYVFDYYDGHVLKMDEITPAHCAKMGEALACIHNLARRTALSAPETSAPIDWAALADALLASDDARAEGELLRAAEPVLKRVTAAAEDAARRLTCMETLCHNDMDPKNVLWQEGKFRIIDLECLGYADPGQEMLDLAISWSEPADETRFKAFVSAYYAAGGERPADEALVYDSRRNSFDWLAYNARRAQSKDPEERSIGRAQLRGTLGKIETDLQARETILQWMREV